MRVGMSLSAGLVLGTLALAASLADVPVARADEAENASISGELLYASNCSACHGLDGRGLTPLAELFDLVTPDMTKIALRRGGWFPEVIVREIIDGRYRAHGERKMPVWGRTLSELEMIAITEHLYSMQVDLPALPQ